MKDERHVRQRRAAGARWRPAAILLAAVLVFLSLPLAGKEAHAEIIGSETDCSLTVIPAQNDSMLADMAGANIQVDLYRIADAQKLSGYDTYEWIPTPLFEGNINIPKQTAEEAAASGTDKWSETAQEAAELVLGKAKDGQTTWNPAERASVYQNNSYGIFYSSAVKYSTTGTEIDPKTGCARFPDPYDASSKMPTPGLYLILAHGTDIEDYAELSSDSKITTRANSHGFAYSFSPVIMSIPTKAPETWEGYDGEIRNTANSGDWNFKPVVNLKPSREERLGGLRIIKQLDTYAQREKGENLTNDQATFIFEVTVKASAAENAETVYHDMISIAFDANSGTSEKSVLIEDLPVDSIATVKEIYPDPDAGNELYTQIKADTDPKTIVADDIVNAEFENDYNDRNNGGGSVTNNFKYTEGENDYDATWGWHQVTDNSETGTVVQPAEE